MDDAVTTEFEAVVRRMSGLPCWSVQISGVGSLANLHFGWKIRRDDPMLHPDFKVSDEERFFQGEIVLYIEDCPWRLDGREAVLASWLDSSEPNGAIDTEMKALMGQTVERAEVSRPGLDLTIYFDGGSVLQIFPDQVDAEQGDNYALKTLQTTFIVAARSILYTE
jgi:hypothetical protein